MDRPIRVQRKRTRGWKMPPNTVYVGRPSKLGNPYIVGDCYPRFEKHGMSLHIIETPLMAMLCFKIWFEKWLVDNPMLLDGLRGKNLACWCPLDQPCHADVLLALANTPPKE